MEHTIGNIVHGTISGIKPYGVFIKFENNFGFCHISNCSHKFIKNLTDLFSIGNEVTAKIIEIDLENNKINLSIKDCENNFIPKIKMKESKEFNKVKEIKDKDTSKPSFEDMLKTYLKNSDERLESIGKRNQKHRKR